MSDNGTLRLPTIYLESMYPIDGRHKTANIAQRHHVRRQSPDRFFTPDQSIKRHMSKQEIASPLSVLGFVYGLQARAATRRFSLCKAR